MFSLPSIWNIVISTAVFIIAAWYARRYLDAQGIPHSMVRGLLVFVLAYIASWGSGEAVDWVQNKVEGKTPPAQATDLSQIMQQLGQVK